MERDKMSRKVKREISSLSFTMNKLYHRISTFRPSTFIWSVVVLAVAVFLFGGGLYDIIVQPLPAVYYSGTFLLVYPQLTEQFLADSMVAMTLYTFGIVGLVLTYQSTKYAYKPRQGYLMLLVGLVLIFIAYIFLEVTIQLKVSGR
jgi:hypothetical protein